MAENHKIDIKGTDGPNKLKMTNKGNVKAKKSDTVEWIVKDNAGVNSIDNIYPKPNNANVFEKGPAPVNGDYKHWIGTINTNITTPIDELYIIDYTTDEGPFSHDPKISVNN
jgi:hypothetical protein